MIFKITLKNKIRYCIYLVLSLFFTSGAFAQYDYLDNTPCNKNNELSIACTNYIQNLDAEGLYTLSKKFLWQYKSLVYPRPDNFDDITDLRIQLMDKSSSLGYFPAIIEKAYEFKDSGQLRLAEEYFLRAEKISGKSFRGQIESTQQLRYLRLIVFTITFVVLLIIFLQLVRKRKWEKLWHRVLILTPYFTITLFFAWFIFGSPDGRAMSPMLHKFVHLVDIRLLFFASPLVVAISYYYLISKRIISKQLAILNITILILVYIGVLLLGYALAPLASQGAGK